MSDQVLDGTLAAAGAGRGFQMDLRLSRAEALLVLGGAIDVAARDEVRAVLASLDVLTYAVVRVDLAAVTFMDSSGLEPLIHTARSRAAAGSQPLICDPVPEPVQRLLRALGMHPTPTLDIQAWANLDNLDNVDHRDR